jgi:hypothetical protein
MANTGAWPIDPTTQTGRFRIELGDVTGVPADPATDPQTATFDFISDAAIDALIAAYPDSIDTAMSKAMTSVAMQMINAAEDIQVDDIKIKTVERAKLMLQMANDLASRAIFTDASSAFSVVGLRTSNTIRYPVM